VGNLHYYSFLSNDEKLDRVNQLFGAWMIAKNAERVRQPGWWVSVKGTSKALPARRYGARGTADRRALTPRWAELTQ
jgi:hypothetical protein